MLRRVSSVVLTAGLAAACAGSAALALDVALLAPGRARHGAASVLHTKRVQRALTARVAEALEQEAPGAGASPDQVRDVTAKALHDRRFVAAFADGIVQVQRHLFHGDRGAIVLPPAPVTAALRDASSKTAPTIAADLPPAAQLNVEIDAGWVPDLRDVARGIDAATLAGLGGGLALVMIGVAGARRPRRALGRVARWAVVIGVAYVVMLWVLPLVISVFGAWPDVAGTYVRATGVPLVFGGVTLAVAGSTTLWLLHRAEVSARHRARRREMAELARRTSWRPPPLERTPQRQPSAERRDR